MRDKTMVSGQKTKCGMGSDAAQPEPTEYKKWAYHFANQAAKDFGQAIPMI